MAARSATPGGPLRAVSWEHRAPGRCLEAEVALLALSERPLAEIRDRVVQLAALGTGSDAVLLIDAGAPAWGAAVIAWAGVSDPQLAALEEHAGALGALALAPLTLGSPSRSDAFGRLLRGLGMASGLAAGLAPHGANLVLVATRRRGRLPDSAGELLGGLAGLLAGAQRRLTLAALADRRLRRQAAVADLGQQALAGAELPALSQAACEAAAAHLDAQMVMVLERAADGLVIRAGVGLLEDSVGLQLDASETLSSRVLSSGQPLLIDDVSREPGFPRLRLARWNDRSSLLVVPVQSGRRPIGTLSVVSATPAAFTDDDITFTLGLANVVALAAERARVQGQLRLSVDELRKSAEDRSRLLAHVVQAQEEERRRIADDIHDDSVQVMTAVALRLATLRRRLGGEKIDPLFANLEHDVRESIARLRHLMFVLRPPALENHGLAAALQSFLALETEEGGLSYTLDDRLGAEPETETRIVAYRIAQEAVANIRKHARATRVDVSLEESEGGVLVTISDDGIGFEPDRPALPSPGHLGLMVMRERAEQSGGWCTVESAPGEGTTVRYRVGSPALRAHEPPAEPPLAALR
jgi:signal transduction histidine kinase